MKFEKMSEKIAFSLGDSATSTLVKKTSAVLGDHFFGKFAYTSFSPQFFRQFGRGFLKPFHQPAVTKVAMKFASSFSTRGPSESRQTNFPEKFPLPETNSKST